jgi:hypothetical protein
MKPLLFSVIVWGMCFDESKDVDMKTSVESLAEAFCEESVYSAKDPVYSAKSAKEIIESIPETCTSGMLMNPMHVPIPDPILIHTTIQFPKPIIPPCPPIVNPPPVTCVDP